MGVGLVCPSAYGQWPCDALDLAASLQLPHLNTMPTQSIANLPRGEA